MTANPKTRDISALEHDSRSIDFITGRSRAAEQLRRRARALVDLKLPVLIHGELGSGRCHLARAIHTAAQDRPSDLLILASTDQSKIDATPNERKAYLLRDIDQLTLGQQARWHQILRDAERGHTQAPRRVLATTSRDLRAESKSGRFDGDLAHLLLRFSLAIPPLRSRRADVSDLCKEIGSRAGLRLRGEEIEMTASAIALLAAQPWPGNVGELCEVLERLIAFCPERQITRDQVRTVLDENVVGVNSSRRAQLGHQRDELVQLIDDTGGNLAEVARRLGMSRGGVIYRAQKFGLLPSRGR